MQESVSKSSSNMAQLEAYQLDKKCILSKEKFKSMLHRPLWHLI